MDTELSTHQLSSLTFDLYTPDEIRRISVKQITEAIAFDNIGRAIVGGLYDPAMGVSPYDKTSLCVTCSLDSTECPGHFGHIELSATLYNPFTIGHLYKLLNAKCFNCHRLRLREKDKKYYYIKILLIKLGLISEAHQFHDIIYSNFSKVKDSENNEINSLISRFISSLSYNQKLYTEDKINFPSSQINIQSYHSSKDTGNNSDNTILTNTTVTDSKKSKPKTERKSKEMTYIDEFETISSDRLKEGKLKSIYDIFKKVKERINEAKPGQTLNDQNTDIQNNLKFTIKDFWNTTKVQKCSKCESFGLKIKKQGYLKFFKYPLSDTKQKQMKGKKINLDKDALMNEDKEIKVESKDKKKSKKSKNIDQDEDESESEDEIDEKSQGADIKYLHPEEVKEQIKLLWNKEKDILNLIFGNVFKKEQRKNLFSVESTGYMIFFLENILVPPIRFRPENRGGGDGVYLHHQSSALSNVLKYCSENRDFFISKGNDDKNISIERVVLENTRYCKYSI